MRIWHRITFSDSRDEGLATILENSGIRCRTAPGLPGQGTLISCDIFEEHPNWETIHKKSTQIGALDLVYTTFENAEILAAQWLTLSVYYKQGYPQPESRWLEDPPNYKDWCAKCGTHTQVSSFRMRGEPRLGKKDFFAFHWTTEPFCTLHVAEELKRHPFTGYDLWDVLVHKTGEPSQIVRQVFVPGVVQPGLAERNKLDFKECDRCGITKFLPHNRGKLYLKKEAISPQLDFYLTHEWFGDGRMAYRMIVISNRVARLILEKQWKGVQLKVVELV